MGVYVKFIIIIIIIIMIIWFLGLFQEYFTYVELIVRKGWAKTGATAKLSDIRLLNLTINIFFVT